MPPPPVTVVIATHNRHELLVEAVDSVLAQTLSAWELMIVDDASTDGTQEWLASGALDPRIRPVVQPAPRERSAARNLGLKAAGSRFVLFLDDDDHLFPTALEALSSALDEHPEAIAAVGGCVVFDARGDRRPEPHPKRRVVRDVWPDVALGWLPVPGRILWRAEAVRSAGGWHEDLNVSEDQELELRSAPLGPWVIDPTPVLHYREHSGQRRPTADAAQRSAGHIEAAIRANSERVGMSPDRVVRAWALMWSAEQAFASGRNPAALTGYARALASLPSGVSSPLIRCQLLHRVRAVAGRTALSGGRTRRRSA